MAQHALLQGYRKIAVLRETSNDAYTAPILKAFERVLVTSGLTLPTPVLFSSKEHPDYTHLASVLGRAQAYLILSNSFDAALIGQAMARQGHTGPILSSSWSMTADLLALGGRQVERMVFASIYDSQCEAPAWRQFRSDFQALFGTEPGFAECYATDALSLLVDVLKDDPSLEGDALRAALSTGRTVHGLQGDFTVNAQGDVTRDLFLLTVRDGQFVRFGL